MSQGLQVEKVRFGVFEADLRSGELRKHGLRIHLQRQPFKILAALVERPGELVTRDELRLRIWGPETVVDFDHSLGSAVNKLREALCDSADTPQFIETLAKRGFRFIAAVEPIFSHPAQPLAPVAPPAPPLGGAATASVPEPAFETITPIAAPSQREASHDPRPWVWRAAALTFAIIASALAIALLLRWNSPPAAPAVVHFRQITSESRVYPGETEIDRFPGVATDGVRVFFPGFSNGRVDLEYILTGGGEAHRFVTPPEISRPAVADISRDGAELLIRSMMWAETEQPLWIAPSTGGSARRLFDVMAHDAAWTPDRKSVLYSSGQDLSLIGRGDGRERKLATLAGRAYWMRYSPDGSLVRFTVLDPKTRATSLWQIAADGKDLHQVLPDWSNPPSECCGNWTADGKYFVFQSAHGGRPNIWGIRDGAALHEGNSAPFEVTAGPLDFFAPVASSRGDQLFAIGANTRRELFHFNLAAHRMEPYMSNVRDAKRSEHGRRSDWIAWISATDGSLWRSREDGSERVELIAPPLSVYMQRWSPDDRRLLVMAKLPGSPYKIYTVSADGGDLAPLLEESRNQADPDWGPDGQTVVFGRLPNYAAEASAPKDIRILNLATKAVSMLPGSTGMFSPRWSPDGRYIAAMTLDQHNLMVFDRGTSKWFTVADGIIHNPAWSRDGKQLYFQQLIEDEVPIYRVTIADRRLERICDRSVSSSADSIGFWGLAPDGGLIGSLLFWSADVYGLNWNPSK